jgi:hypothetical protein
LHTSVRRTSNTRAAEWQALGERLSMNLRLGPQTPPALEREDDAREWRRRAAEIDDRSRGQ